MRFSPVGLVIKSMRFSKVQNVSSKGLGVGTHIIHETYSVKKHVDYFNFNFRTDKLYLV